MARLKDKNWNCGEENPDGSCASKDVDHAQLATLMDIRDELKELNRLFRCENFLSMPRNVNKLRSAVEGLRRDQRKK